MRIELGAGALPQLRAGRLGAQRGAVHPIGGHRLVGVGHCEDACLHRYVLRLEPLRVAPTVGSLVVGEHPAADVVEVAAAQDVGPDLGVPAHLLRLALRERAWLGQDRVRDSDLADVVKVAGDLHASHVP